MKVLSTVNFFLIFSLTLEKYLKNNLINSTNLHKDAVIRFLEGETHTSGGTGQTSSGSTTGAASPETSVTSPVSADSGGSASQTAQTGGEVGSNSTPQAETTEESSSQSQNSDGTTAAGQGNLPSDTAQNSPGKASTDEANPVTQDGRGNDGTSLPGATDSNPEVKENSGDAETDNSQDDKENTDLDHLMDFDQDDLSDDNLSTLDDTTEENENDLEVFESTNNNRHLKKRDIALSTNDKFAADKSSAQLVSLNSFFLSIIAILTILYLIN